MHSQRFLVFFFNDTATTEIYTLSLHDALPIYWNFAVPPYTGRAPCLSRTKMLVSRRAISWATSKRFILTPEPVGHSMVRSEEHTSELQSRLHLVCRLLLEKKSKVLTPEPIKSL